MKQHGAVIIFLIALFSISPLFGEKKFVCVDHWVLGDQQIYTRFIDSLVDTSGQVVGIFERSSVLGRIITNKEIIPFAPYGMGPDDLFVVFGMCDYNNDIAFLEKNNKVKIFTKKGNTYTWKETKWLKMGEYPPLNNDILFFNNKWYLGGIHFINVDNKKQVVSLLQVYSKDGKPLKELIEREYPARNYKYEMDHFVMAHKNYVYFMVENELKLYEIADDQLKILREIKLETPAFYKEMPENFYQFKLYDKDPMDFIRDIHNWKSSYSRVTRAEFSDNFIAIQIRTCSTNQKKFAMLFYDAAGFQLKEIFFTDDYFIGLRNGKFYFYGNGEPGLDDGTDKCIIQIYSFTEKK